MKEDKLKTTHQIKRGVSLYSYQEEFFTGKMNLEDCIAAAAKTGATGIEIIGEQMVKGFPVVTDAFVDNWFGLMDKYGMTPVAHDMFIDYKRYKHRLLTEEEQRASLLRDIQFANKLGCKIIRIIANTTPELMEWGAPYAEEYDVKLAIEIHSPYHIHSSWMTRHWEVMEKTGSKYLGWLPDMGIFTKKFPRVQAENFIRKGADPKVAKLVSELYEQGWRAEHIIYAVKQISNKPIDLALAEVTRMIIYDNPISLTLHKDRIFHIHAKFLEMQDDYTEQSIPYADVIEVLKECNFSGYLSSEYEGNRHIQDAFEVDSVEQVRRQQEMFRRLLD